jgi:NitT/TauT family transport system permease protein
MSANVSTHSMAHPAAHKKRRSIWSFAIEPTITVLSIVMFLCAWQFIATMFFTPAFFPGPVLVWRTAVEMVSSGELQTHVAISMRRIMMGFGIGSVVAIPIGLLLGSSRIMRAAFAPYVHFFRFVPAIAWLTPVVIWFGIGELSKILIIVYTTVFIVVVNTMVGVSAISPNKIRAARSLGASPAQTFFHVTLPAALPMALTGMRIAMGNSFMTVVSAEMVAAESGLGYLIFNARIYMATDQIFISILCLGILGLLTDWIFRVLIRRYASHYGVIE